MCDVTADTATTLPATLDAPSRARDFVEQHCCTEHGSRADVAAQLLASELITNAVLSGASPITLSLSCSGYTLRLEVSDRERSDRPVRSADGLSLLLVDKVAHEWGTRRDGPGRTTWCTVRTGVVPEQRSRSQGGAAAAPRSLPAGR